MGRDFEGNSLDEAIITASRELGVEIDDLNYELVEEGRKGVFGLGAKLVRIRVELPPGAPAESAPPPSTPQPRQTETRQRPRQPKPKRESRPETETEPEAESHEATPLQRSVEETLDRMFRLMNMELRIRTTQSGKNLRVHLGGPDRRMLLQKDGQLLSALHFLLNRMARRTWPEAGRIQVQCDGRGERRDEELVELVREVASQVDRTGESKQLHPMNPYERRLVHLTVREFPELESVSEGDGFLKKITVSKTDR